ncbi:hypothetical protein ACQEVZ_55755 [Dactylosporangium sp. CA-152071]|uniref:hypothetical protein n=1 Tax=Dactylosporangium sp. CA-152071 TaxID=3239933 RepID=UPI003D8F0701
MNLEAAAGATYLNPLAEFLVHRCSPAFLRLWAAAHEGDLESLLRFGGYINAHWQPRVLGRLNEADALPEPIRCKAVEQLEELAMDLMDGGWLDEPVCRLFTESERYELLERIREEILPNIFDEIDRSAEGYDDDVHPEGRYQEARSTIAAYKRAFADDEEIVDSLDDAERYLERAIESAQSEYEEPSSRLAEPSLPEWEAGDGRDEFDDISDGH